CAPGSALIFVVLYPRRCGFSPIWLLVDLLLLRSVALTCLFSLSYWICLNLLLFPTNGLYGGLSGSILCCAFMGMVSSGFEVGFAPCFYIQDLIEV
ncbi:unnamed protein product, partial [Arabidopsis halleri]